MAGALGLALAGPRRYAGYVVDDPFLNAEATQGRPCLTISAARSICWTAACVIEAAVYAALALVV